MSVAIKNLAKSDRRTFRWQAWENGQLREVVITPAANDEKHVKLGGVRGRIYERVGSSLRTISGVVKQDGEGKLYFVRNS